MNPLLSELRQFRQWVVHSSNKIPLRAFDFGPASVVNPGDWTDYDTAKAAIAHRDGYGLGFVLTVSDPFCVVDLDASEDARIVANQTEIYNALDSYSERSPSGKGCHIWCKGSIPTGKKIDKIEVYSSLRYFTVTLEPVKDVPVFERQSQLNELYSAIAKAQGNEKLPTEFDSLPEVHSDAEIYKQAVQAANGDKFKELWEGCWNGLYPSQSEADQALCNILAFYTDNRAQVLRLFLASALGKRKKAERKDIQKRLIDKAFDQKLPTVSITSNVPLPTKVSKPASKGTVELYTVTAQDIEPIQWLWEGFLPLGKLTLLAGAPGTGKSTLAFSMAATVSTGGDWPNRARCKPGHVVIYSTEDDVKDTIAPRLQAMNATLKNIHFIKGKRSEQGLLLPFDPATDMHYLQASIKQCGPVALLIIDPVTSAVTGDMNKTNEVRRGLQSLVDFASEMNCAVVGITHFAKGTSGRNPADRVIGSIAFSAFARVVLVAAKEENSEQRVFTRAKSNVGEDSGGFIYSIEPTTLFDGITATRIAWGGMLGGSAREILANVEGDETENTTNSQINEARTFLLAELTKGPRSAKELIALAKDQLNISEKTLQRARHRLGVETYKQGFQGGYLWRLTIAPNNYNQPL